MDHFNYPISPSTPDLDDTPATSPMSSVTMSELDTINGSTEWNLLHKLFASDIPMFAPSATDAQLNLSSTTCSPYINAHDTSLPMFAAISPRSDMTDVSDESHHHHHHHHQVTSSTSGEDSQCEDTTPSQKAPVRQKPGRKRKGEERRPEDQARVRMLRNRAAAQASRERKRQHVAEMEETNKRLRIDNEALKQRAETAERKQESLMGQVEQLSKQVNDLLAFFASANATVTTPVSEHGDYSKSTIVPSSDNDLLASSSSPSSSSTLLSVFSQLFSLPSNNVMTSAGSLGGSEVSPVLVQDASISQKRRPFCPMCHHIPSSIRQPHRRRPPHYPPHCLQHLQYFMKTTITPSPTVMARLNSNYLNCYLARLPIAQVSRQTPSNLMSFSSALTTSAVSVALMWTQWTRVVYTCVWQLYMAFTLFYRSNNVKAMMPIMLNSSFQSCCFIHEFAPPSSSTFTFIT